MYSTRQKLISILMLCTLALFATVSMTYAWMSVSRIPFVSDVALSVTTETSFLFCPDEDGKPNGEWTNYLDVSALLSDSVVVLRPVTYTPSGFQKIVYAVDGRTNGVTPVSASDFNVIRGSAAANSSMSENTGMLMKLDLWVQSNGIQGDVYLADAVETVDGQMGIGTFAVGAPVWNTSTLSHQNGGYGAEAAVRAGFEATPCDAEYNPTGATTFSIYEPNANIHYDGSDGYHATESVNGGPLIANDRLSVQRASSWSETDPAREDTVIYSAGDFTQTAPLFTLGESSYTRLTIYFWLEGQDGDCIAAAVADSVNIAANLTFTVAGEQRETGIVRR